MKKLQKVALLATLMMVLAIFCSRSTVSYASIPPSVLGPKPTKNHPQQKPLIAKTSCYYRVLKGQRKYATGSYRGDIRLNGTGITNSGKLVGVGYLAADLRYHHIGEKFHVFIDGKDHGIWTVEDKGGAIKGPRRFDLCAGIGDTGRKIAESWGLGEDHIVTMYRVGRNS